MVRSKRYNNKGAMSGFTEDKGRVVAGSAGIGQKRKQKVESKAK